MKKLVLIFSICLTGLLAKAQQSQEVTDFVTYSQTMNKKVDDASNGNSNALGIAESKEWLDHYFKLSADARKNMQGFTQSMYYNLACFYARESKKDTAYIYLHKSLKDGYNNFAHIQVDSDLTGLHNDDEFKSIVKQLRDKYDYSYVLQQAGPYNNNKADLPVFTYQSADAPELIALKAKFNLDSIAGHGDDIEKIKNLLRWTHNEIRHDGNSNNPPSKNAVDLIAVCKKESRGVNCRMMSTVLRDVYQAEGFKTRIVTCKPKDTADFDCHVITVVWVKSLNKWVWMDPTFNAYVTDAKGNLLNIEEVRQRLLAGGSDLVLNNDANWNNEQKETQENYLGYYMTKNLYWLQCSAKSEWDLETRKPGINHIEYIDLYPGTYTTIFQLKKTAGDEVEYATNNPDYFWQKP